MNNKPQRVLYFLTLTLLPLIAFFTTSIATFVLGIAVSNSLVATLLVIAGIIGFISTILAAPVFYRSALRQANIEIAFLPTPQIPTRNIEVEDEWSDDDLFGDWDEEDEKSSAAKSDLKSGKNTGTVSSKTENSNTAKESTNNRPPKTSDNASKYKRGAGSGSSVVEKDSDAN